MTGLLTGHCHLKGHLFKLGLVNSPECDRCKQASETASHVLCDWHSDLIEIQVPGSSLYETRWLWNISVSRILHFVQGAGLLNDWAKGLHKKLIMVEVHGSLWCRPICILFFSIIFYSIGCVVGWWVDQLVWWSVSQSVFPLWSVQHMNSHFTSANFKFFFHKLDINMGFRQNSKINGIRWLNFCLLVIVLFVCLFVCVCVCVCVCVVSLSLSLLDCVPYSEYWCSLLCSSYPVDKVLCMVHICINCSWHASVVWKWNAIFSTLYKVAHYEPQ
jgi:hypothetical protein